MKSKVYAFFCHFKPLPCHFERPPCHFERSEKSKRLFEILRFAQYDILPCHFERSEKSHPCLLRYFRLRPQYDINRAQYDKRTK